MRLCGWALYGIAAIMGVSSVGVDEGLGASLLDDVTRWTDQWIKNRAERRLN